jgi:succinate dehydrogenase/fumarate reductase flavoprotein subunit
MRERDYDLVVIGFGLAGAIAGIESSRYGARTLVIDSATHSRIGGSSIVSGHGFISTESPEQFARYVQALRAAHPAPLRWGESIARVPEWISEYVAVSRRTGLGADFPEVTGAESITRWQVESVNMTQELQQRALKMGAELMVDTRVVHLQRDRGSRIVLEVSSGDRPWRITSRRGVVIATGGYGGLRHTTSAASLGSPYAVGDGPRLAIEVGAIPPTSVSFVGPYYGFCIPASRSAVTPWPLYEQSDQLWNERRVPRLVAQRTGHRLPWPEGHLHGLLRERGGTYQKQRLPPALMLVTESEMAAGPIVRPWPDGHAQGWVRRFGPAWSSTNERELAKAWIRPLTAARRKQVQGSDSGEYFSVPVRAVSLNSLGGLECDEGHGVLTRFGRLDGVFAAGEVASRFKEMYQGSANISECIVSGRLSVASALQKRSG